MKKMSQCKSLAWTHIDLLWGQREDQITMAACLLLGKEWIWEHLWVVFYEAWPLQDHSPDLQVTLHLALLATKAQRRAKQVAWPEITIEEEAFALVQVKSDLSTLVGVWDRIRLQLEQDPPPQMLNHLPPIVHLSQVDHRWV